MRYSIKAHSDFYTVRDDMSGDILTFPFQHYIYQRQAREDASRVADALNVAYAAGLMHDRALGGAVRHGYVQGNTDKSREILERWRAQNTDCPPLTCNHEHWHDGERAQAFDDYNESCEYHNEGVGSCICTEPL